MAPKPPRCSPTWEICIDRDARPELRTGPPVCLTLNRLSVVLVTLASIGFALAGQRAYALLEDADELPLAGMLVPLVMGIYGKRRSAAPAIASMGLGLALWLLHYFADWTYFLEPWTADLALRPPASITITALGFIVYIGVNSAKRTEHRA